MNNWHAVRHSAQASSYKCVYNSANSSNSFIVFIPLDMGETVVGMATKTAFAIFLLCFVQVSQKIWLHKIRNGSHTTVCACPPVVSAVPIYSYIVSAALRNTTQVNLFIFVHGLDIDTVSTFDQADSNDAVNSG